MATTVTSKGQVTIPKKVREYLGIEPGAAIDFQMTPDGRVVLQLAKPGRGGRGRPRSRFDKLVGRATVKMTTEEIMALTRGDR